MKDIKGDYERGVFSVIVLGIVFDTKERKILIGKRKPDEHIKELTWAFPGGMPEYKENLEESIKREVKEETNLDVESLGAVFAKVYPEKEDLLAIYYLCEVTGNIKNQKEGEDFTEIKWVDPEELENYFTTSFHPSLKEYIINLK